MNRFAPANDWTVGLSAVFLLTALANLQPFGAASAENGYTWGNLAQMWIYARCCWHW